MTGLRTDFAEFTGQQAEPPRVARYAVNEAMIRNWVEALDDRNPVYVDDAAAKAAGRSGVVAPPAMCSTWIMAGYRRYRELQELRREGAVEDFAYSRLMNVLDAAGYTSVVATDVEQEYVREISPGTHVTCHFTIEAVSGCKRTALGYGHFVTLRKHYVDEAGELLVDERFRILRFRPAERSE
ncbi:MaoC family dehydratase N-terminal domain-containing protein [Amycolatopsis sp. Poz14]|uniref:FAS1-like dehydratase domain-containing protein n=1 Tax=Amycolatopsis sp. Poz14 TaxID=1447705 RepID=UPI001EE84165|nr:MaoC family dehydratase N-terminal domain-containing protein [Amycolatopsis sp. Poz14]MCG3753011.1 MaoC family dehydratase N-terminal domain-containing protein [Amycolatopsis sp. Poz14]